MKLPIFFNNYNDYPTLHSVLPPMSIGEPLSSHEAVGRGQPLIGTSIFNVSPALTIMSPNLLKSILGFSGKRF